jgi:hypothetical protein
MRKLIVLAVTVATMAGAGVALAGQAATNANGRFIDLRVAVTPPVAGTAKAPQGVGATFDSFTGNRINGNTPSHNTSVTVRINKGFKENGALFPSCKISILAGALTTCSKSARIGTGTAEGEVAGVGGAPPSFIPATLAIYNGKPLAGAKGTTLIVIASINGKPAAENDFTVKQQLTGPYGLAFTTIQFPNLPPAAFDITKFSLKIPDRTITHKVHGKSVKVHLIEAPTTCKGSWQFAQTNTFSDAAPLTATDSQPCIK